MSLSAPHFIGILLVLVVTVFVGAWSGHRVKDASDYHSGGNTRALVVSGAVTGTLVGGSSTIGTAQLAFHYGLSAWWFTLGSGLGCLMLALFFVQPLRRQGAITITGIISREFGIRTGVLATLLSTVGIFINLLPQLISGQTLICTLFPQLPSLPVILFVVLLMALYIIFGGVLAMGLVGVLKLVMLYGTVAAVTILSLVLDGGGLSAFWHNLPHNTYFSLFSRGISTDLGSCLSLVFGVLSTQSYAQAIASARSEREAKKGVLLSALLIPPIGVGGILVGLFMRLNAPALSPAQALPVFIMDYIPAFPGGIMLAVLLVTTIGSGAGLALGISNLVTHDLVKRFSHRLDDPRRSLTFSRAIILLVLALGFLLTAIGIGDAILLFSYLSMGLRAAVLFFPLCAALFFPGTVDRRWAAAAVCTGPAAVFAGNLLHCPFDPLFLGLIVNFLFVLFGKRFRR